MFALNFFFLCASNNQLKVEKGNMRRLLVLMTTVMLTVLSVHAQRMVSGKVIEKEVEVRNLDHFNIQLHNRAHVFKNKKKYT